MKDSAIIFYAVFFTLTALWVVGSLYWDYHRHKKEKEKIRQQRLNVIKARNRKKQK